ncbi:MAG: hypothetical protein WDA24_07790 [Tissierellales bacterium]
MKREVLRTIVVILVLTICTTSIIYATSINPQASKYLDRYSANSHSEGD